MDTYEQFGSTANRIPYNCTLKDYRKNYASESYRKTIRTLSIIGYVLCGVNLLLAIFVNIFALLDVIIFTALTVGMHVNKSKGCAIAILVYACVGALLSLLSGGSLTGWGWIALSIGAITTINKIDAEYKTQMANQTAAPEIYEY